MRGSVISVRKCAVLSLILLGLLISTTFCATPSVASKEISLMSISGVPPPSSGTWNVTEPTTVENEVLTINGSINVTSSLTVRNSVIRLNYSAGARFIHVCPGGSLTLINSTIEPIEGSGSMLMNISVNTELEIRGSIIKSLDTAIYFTIHIYSDDAVILDSQIDTHGRGNIYFYGSNLDITNTSISSRYLYFQNSSAVDIDVHDVTVDVNYNFYIYSHNVRIENSKVLADRVYVYGSNFSIYDSEITASYFYVESDSVNASLVNTLFDSRLTIYGNNATVINCVVTKHARVDSISIGTVIRNSTFEEDLELGGDYITVLNSSIGSPENEFYPVVEFWGSHITLENNKIYALGEALYAHPDAEYVKIQDNLIYGYCVFSGDYIEMVNNTVIGTCEYRGFEIYGGDYLTFKYNYIYNGSFIVYVWSLSTLGTYTIENNYVNDLPVYFWVSETVKTLKGERVGSLILIQCRNITVENIITYGLTIVAGGNITIRNIITRNSYYGIYLGGTGLENVEIWNASVIRNYYGVYIKYVDNLTILNSTIAFNAYDGVAGSYTHAINAHIHNSSIISNIGFGVKISIVTGEDLNVTYNWWGSELGPEVKSSSDPYDPEEVYDNDVIYEPYLKKPATQIDSVPPSVTIVSPEQNEFTSNVTIEILIEASDDSGIDYLTIYGDGELIARLREPPYKAIWITTAGEHKITVYAYDMYGNCNHTSVTFIVDLAPPEASITSPAENAYVGGNVTISIDAQDDAGIQKVEIYVDNQKIAELTEAPYTYEWNTEEYDDGEHVIKAKAFDYAGLSAEDQITVYVDNTPPTIGEISAIEGTYINSTAMENVVIQVEVSDALSGVSEVILQYRIGEIGNWRNITMTKKGDVWEATIPIVPAEQTIYVRIIAEDNVGNQAVSETTFEIPAKAAPRIPNIFVYIIIALALIIAILIVVKYIRKR